MTEPLHEITLFSDGACSGNPGPGGWSYILRNEETGKEKRDSGAEPLTTNNRMELIAVIEGLKSLKMSCEVRLVTDSSYVTKGIEEWMAGWKARGWKRKDGKKLKPVKNVELWQQLDSLIQDHQIRCEWVRGHSGHPENEECDLMAVQEYKNIMGTGQG